MSTRQYRTKTEFIPRSNVNVDDAWEIAVDLGYSAVKTFSPNMVACCPSFAKRVQSNFQYAGKTPKESILYRDNETNEMWVVGEVAQDIMEPGDTSDSDKALYGRDRYFNPMFKVCTRTGLALGLQSNKFGSRNDRRIIVQTGLPEKYLNDEPMLREVLVGHHNFSLKIGSGNWIIYDFTLSNEDVFVMSQPRGTLFSVCVTNDGNFREDAPLYLDSSGIIFDPGFGTLDIFPIGRKGHVENGETFPDLGMRRILQETSNAIQEKYHVDVPVPFMQMYLEEGKVIYSDMRRFISEEYSFEEDLYEASNRICDEAMTRLGTLFDLGQKKYMVVTGGTGAAWFDRIQDKLKSVKTLQLIRGNVNDNLPCTYSNVRGYYMYRYTKLKASK